MLAMLMITVPSTTIHRRSLTAATNNTKKYSGRIPAALTNQCRAMRPTGYRRDGRFEVPAEQQRGDTHDKATLSPAPAIISACAGSNPTDSAGRSGDTTRR
jgi:hypothetical protein